MKMCPRCGVERPDDMFYEKATSRQCKVCFSIYNRMRLLEEHDDTNTDEYKKLKHFWDTHPLGERPKYEDLL